MKKDFILKIRKQIFFEQTSSSRDLILTPSNVLYHSTGEKFEGDLRGGGYDKILWTTESSIISRAYIPASGSKTIVSTDYITGPNQSEFIQKLQKQIGIVYDYSDMKWKGSFVSSYKIAPVFEKINKEYYDALKLLTQKQNEYNEIRDEIIDIKDMSEKKEKLKQANIIYSEVKEIEKKLQDVDIQSQKNKYTNLELIKAGYTPYEDEIEQVKSNPRRNYSWKIRITDGNNPNPSSYRQAGKIFELRPKRNMKIYDYSFGREGDLTDVDYHKLGLFEKIREAGYDGVKIHDFAQIESEGNFGHTSIGFFPDSIKDLSVKIIEDVYHPTEEEIRNAFKTGKW